MQAGHTEAEAQTCPTSVKAQRKWQEAGKSYRSRSQNLPYFGKRSCGSVRKKARHTEAEAKTCPTSVKSAEEAAGSRQGIPKQKPKPALLR